MMNKPILSALAAMAALAATTVGAHAATFSYSTDFSTGVGAEWTVLAGVNSGDAGILGQLANGDTSATLTQTSVGDSTANGGTLTFDLLGFRTLDGVNRFQDTFSLKINGVLVFQGAFPLGGGGGEAIYVNTNGATVSGVTSDLRQIIVPFTVVTGANTFDFSYSPLQDFGDEAWGLDNVSIRADVTDPVTSGAIPEPGTWALMILGFGAAGAGLRSRRRQVPA